MVDKYNSTYHRSIKLIPSDARNPSNYQHVHNALNANVRKATPPKFHVGDEERITRMKGTFGKGFTPSWTEEVFTIRSVEATNPPTYTINDQLGELVRGAFYEQELQLSVQEIFRIERVLRKKKNQIYVKLARTGYWKEWMSKNYKNFNLTGWTIITCVYLDRVFSSKNTRSSGKVSRVD